MLWHLKPWHADRPIRRRFYRALGHYPGYRDEYFKTRAMVVGGCQEIPAF